MRVFAVLELAEALEVVVATVEEEPAALEAVELATVDEAV